MLMPSRTIDVRCTELDCAASREIWRRANTIDPAQLRMENRAEGDNFGIITSPFYIL